MTPSADPVPGLRVAVNDRGPCVDPTAWVAPNATLVGDVRVNADASIWYGATLRADLDAIEVGVGSNVQDVCVMHTDPGYPLYIGREVSVGHAAILHGCTIDDGALIGMGVIVMNGAVIGAESVVGAGALITEGMVVPPRSLVLGAPARVRREVTDDEQRVIARNAEIYRRLRKLHNAAAAAADPAD